MAATTMATAAGAVVLLYYVFSRRMSSPEDFSDGDLTKSKSKLAKKRLSRRPALAPATWLETIYTLTETLRFTYGETLGKWPIGDLAFGIKYLIRRQVRPSPIPSLIDCFISFVAFWWDEIVSPYPILNVYLTLFWSVALWMNCQNLFFRFAFDEAAHIEHVPVCLFVLFCSVFVVNIIISIILFWGLHSSVIVNGECCFVMQF